MSQKGVSLVELLVAVGIISILFSVGWLALPNLRTGSELDAWTAEVKTTIYQAQSQTINGIPSGVYFETSRFVLFPGDNFIEGDPQNQENQLPVNLIFTAVNLPESTIRFEPVNGYVKNFTAPFNLNLQETNTGQTRTITINRLGMVEIE